MTPSPRSWGTWPSSHGAERADPDGPGSAGRGAVSPPRSVVEFLQNYIIPMGASQSPFAPKVRKARCHGGWGQCKGVWEPGLTVCSASQVLKDLRGWRVGREPPTPPLDLQALEKEADGAARGGGDPRGSVLSACHVPRCLCPLQGLPPPSAPWIASIRASSCRDPRLQRSLRVQCLWHLPALLAWPPKGPQHFQGAWGSDVPVPQPRELGVHTIPLRDPGARSLQVWSQAPGEVGCPAWDWQGLLSLLGPAPRLAEPPGGPAGGAGTRQGAAHQSLGHK